MKKILSLLTVLVVMSLSTAVYAQLPSITLKSMEGKSVRLDTLSNGGKPIIIDLWATWCKPCQRELSAINEAYEEWQQETGVKVIAVSVDQAQNINKVKPMVNDMGWNFEVLLDPNSDLFRAIGAASVPFTLILDGQGKVVFKSDGYADGDEEELIKKVRELVK